MPNSTPLRDIAVTSDEPGTWAAASMHSLAAAIERLSAKWSLPARNLSTSTAPSSGAIAGASLRASSAEAATDRLWPSSPMPRACPISVRTSIGSDARTAASRTGPSTSAIQRSRSITSGP
jgi:hypothetical protein